MKIACISDLHLAANDFADSFQHKEESFLFFLDHLEDHYDQIVLNGDIYDPYKSLRTGQYVNQLSRIKENYPRLVERFNQENYVQIAGNHDYILEEMGYPEYYTFQSKEGTQYFFTHGHLFDPLRGKGPLVVFLTSLVGWFEKLGWKNAEPHISWLGEKIASWIKNASDEVLRNKVQSNFINDGKPYVIVMGHSHEIPTRFDFGNNVYLNSGACVRKRLEFVHIDTTENDYNTKKWSKTNRYGVATETSYFGSD